MTSSTNAWAIDELIEHVPEVKYHNPVLIDQDEVAGGTSSTGFIGDVSGKEDSSFQNLVFNSNAGQFCGLL